MKHTRRSLFGKLAGGIAAVAGVKVAAKAAAPAAFRNDATYLELCGGLPPDAPTTGNADWPEELPQYFLRCENCPDTRSERPACLLCMQKVHRVTVRGGDRIEITLPRDAWGACISSEPPDSAK